MKKYFIVPIAPILLFVFLKSCVCSTPSIIMSPAYELRTKNPEKYNNSGNQCIYDKKGTLCTNIPTAGTADKISPNFSTGQHYNIDVVPFDLAKGLGFSYVEKYYEVRPIW